MECKISKKAFNCQETTLVKVKEQSADQQNLQIIEKIVLGLTSTVNRRDENTGKHSYRVGNLARKFGQYLGCQEQDIHYLNWGGFLHDIGKIDIPDQILLKPGKLTKNEYSVMQKHPMLGVEICQNFPILNPLLPMIRHHHERWDGSGYPDGIERDAIDHLVQIIQVVDIYDALTNARSYKRAFSQKESLDILHNNTAKGKHNREIIKAFNHFLAKKPHSIPDYFFLLPKQKESSISIKPMTKINLQTY